MARLQPRDAVNPTAYYQSQPAPMGIADFGVSQGGASYAYNTTRFMTNFSWSAIRFGGTGALPAADAWITLQLNVVLRFVDGGHDYVYWIQDVAFLNATSGELGFEDNIWNFSSTGYCLDNAALSGNGTVYSYGSGCGGYYAVAAASQPGADQFMPTPGAFSLLVRSYSSGGRPAVAFEYWDGASTGFVSYDNVLWPWARSVTSDSGFVVDGSTYTPSGNYFDAEFTLGGPGGGSESAAANATLGASELFYWNGHNFQSPRSVWNFGSDTAETVTNTRSSWSAGASSAADGTPLLILHDGSGSGVALGNAFNETAVGFLGVAAPSAPAGTIGLGQARWSYIGGAANLTLAAGVYTVWVNSTGSNVDLGLCDILAGRLTSASLSSGCGPAVSAPAPTPLSVDVGEAASFTTTLLSAGAGNDSFSWSASPSTGLGCLPSNASRWNCTPSIPGSYLVTVRATDAASRTSSSATTTFAVEADPSVGRPTVTPGAVDVGQLLQITTAVSGGVRPYSFRWSGLPPGCSGAGPEVNCTPTAPDPGAAINVSVTDATGFAVASATVVLVVSSDPSVGLAPSRARLDVGQRERWTATVLGGSGGFVAEWGGLPLGCPTTTNLSLVCRAAASGSWVVGVNVTDSNGGLTSGTGTVLVAPRLQLLASHASGTDVVLGSPYAASVNVTGGQAPIEYVWSGLPSGCSPANSSSLTCSPGVPGSFTVRVEVVDGNGGTLNASWTLTVRSSAAPAPTSPVLYGELGLLVVGAMVGLALAVAARRRRRGSRPLPPYRGRSP